MIRDTSAQDRSIAPPTQARTRYRLPLLFAAIALLASTAAVPSIQRWLSASVSVPRERVRVATVERGDLVRDVSAQGRIVAAVAPTLFAPVGGIVSLQIKAGDPVKREQVLAIVRSPELESRLAQEQSTLQSLEIEVARQRISGRQAELTAQRGVEAARITRDAALRELQRAEAGFKLHAIAEVDYLRAQDALRSAEITLTHAEADAGLQAEARAFELETRELALSRQRLIAADVRRQVDELQVRAPVDGVIGTLNVADRTSVAANQALLSVVDLSQLEVEVLVPETYADDLGIGMDAEITFGGKQHAGTLSAVSPEVVNGQVVSRLRFRDAQPEGMRQNQRVTARVMLETRAQALMVRRGPFLDADGGRQAFVLGADGVAHRTPIQIGATSLTHVEVLSGLSEGDQILISGGDAFAGADAIRITD